MSLPAGRSPLRARHQQPLISKATSSRLSHLHQVASWASLHVPPLGAFLGSHLASTSETFGCPLPASSKFSCQRCESVLHVGKNCSFRLKNKQLKERDAVTKGISTPISSFIYSCQHCAFESEISGTTKAYVKTELSKRAAHHNLSEHLPSLNICMTEKLIQPIKGISNNVVPSSAFLKESPGSINKRTKRKGWQSLKQLCASPVDFSPAGSKSALSHKSASPFLPQSKKVDSAREMPTVSQTDLKCLMSTSDLVGELHIKTMSKLELSEGDAGSDKMLDVLKSLRVMSTSLGSDAEATILNSKLVGPSISSEKPSASTTATLQQSDASGSAMIVEEKCLRQKLNIHHTKAAAAQSKQLFLVAGSVMKLSAQDTVSSTQAQSNFSCAVLRSDSANVAPISSSQGSLMVKSSIEHLDDQERHFPLHDKEVEMNNCSSVKAVRWKKRKHDDNNGCNVLEKKEICKAKAEEMRWHDWDLDVKQTSSIKPSSIWISTHTPILACKGNVKPTVKKKPLFRRFGRQWFAICKSSRRLDWRII